MSNLKHFQNETTFKKKSSETKVLKLNVLNGNINLLKSQNYLIITSLFFGGNEIKNIYNIFSNQ